MKKSSVYLILILFLNSCSGKAPEIVKNEWMLNYVSDLSTNTIQEELSCFLLINDPDGNDDIGNLYLINDELELFWEIPSDLWVRKNAGKNTWFGFNRFQPPGNIFESGAYRIQAVDKGGLITETRLFIPANRLLLENIKFPDVTVRRDSIKIEGSYPKFLIWFYDSEGKLLHTHYTGKGTYTLSQLMDNRGGVQPEYFWIFIFIESRYSAIKSGPYKIIR